MPVKNRYKRIFAWSPGPGSNRKFPQCPGWEVFLERGAQVLVESHAWMSKEMSKRLGSVGYKPNISHLYVGYNPFKRPLILNSWDIQIPPFFGDVWISSVVETTDFHNRIEKLLAYLKITAISSLSSHHISSISIGILDDWMTA